MQDKRGFTWIGTDDGLNRYDGHNFRVFKNIPGQPGSVSGNNITDLHEDKDEILWIATADGGITRYDYRLEPDKQFKQFKHQPGNDKSIPENMVNALLEHKGFIWLATSGAGVLRFDKKKEAFLKPAGTGNWTIYDLCVDKGGTIWAGHVGGSILKIDPESLQLQNDKRYANAYAALPHVVVTSLFRDSQDNIWFGSWDKAIYRYSAFKQIEESFTHNKQNAFSFGPDEAITFNEDKSSRIWIGSKTSGLYLYDPVTTRFYNYRHDPAKEGTISSDKINCIYIDDHGIIWLGTNNGIDKFDPSQQQFKQEFLPASSAKPGEPTKIYDFFFDDQRTWIGTNKGLYIKHSDKGYQVNRLSYKGSELSITKIFRDENGNFYLGTDYSLFSYDPFTGKIALLPGTENDLVMGKLIESRIVSLLTDTINGHPVLITSPYGHYFSYYDFAEKRWISRHDTIRKIIETYGIRDNLIRKILKTKAGHLILANAKYGLTVVDKDKTASITYVNDPSLTSTISNNNLYDVKEAEDGSFWISTYGGGLNHFNAVTKKFRHFPSVNNLLEGLETDQQGNVWAISNGNLQKFDLKSNSFSYLELPDIEQTAGVSGNIHKDREGRLYVAGDGYYIAFDPKAVKVEKEQPQVFLTDFRIFDQSYSHLLNQGEIALRHTQNFFTLNFSAPSYSSSTPVQYSYKLEGVDPDWVMAGTNNQAHYTNLNHGEYVFKVRASSHPGSWSNTITTTGIRIIPPIWKRWWFYMSCALLLSALTYMLYRYRINELLKRQAIRNKIAQDLHDSMGSTLSSISVLSQVAKIYQQNNKQTDLNIALEKIGSTSSEMISEMSDIVWAINPRNDSMEKIVQRMESFALPLLKAKEISGDFKYDPFILTLNLPMETRKNFYLIFKEAINNALKYADCKSLQVSLTHKNKLIELAVNDDGKGFDVELMNVAAAKSLSGNGLYNMKRRAAELKGKCIIDAAPGKGTRILVQFPIP